MMKKWLAIGGLILVTVIWGGGFVASDMALGSMKPFQIMMVRFLLASVLMGAIPKSRIRFFPILVSSLDYVVFFNTC